MDEIKLKKCTNCAHMMRLTNANDGSRYMWCPVHEDSYDETEPRDCEAYEPATNFDVIRRMNAEELAFVLMCPCDCNACRNPEMHCRDCLLQWLKEEVAT